MELLVLARLLLLQLLLLVLVSGQDDMGDMDMESMMPAPGQETGPMGAAKKVRHLPTCLVIVILKWALTWFRHGKCQTICQYVKQSTFQPEMY